MSLPNSSVDLATARAVLYSAVVSDCCDHIGLRHQTLAPGLTPLTGGSRVLCGWARTVRSAAVSAAPLRAYGEEIDFLDGLQADQVVIAVMETDECAFWGELFSAAAQARGAAGLVVDGLIRDRTRIEPLGFATYARGQRPTDCLGRASLTGAGEPVLIRGVTVNDGDLVVADSDGVVVVPRQNASDVVERAIAKVRTESQAKRMLQEGATLREAWERFGVL